MDVTERLCYLNKLPKVWARTLTKQDINLRLFLHTLVTCFEPFVILVATVIVSIRL
jgi:hypothetical protein